MNKSNWQLKNTKLLFYLGSFRSVASNIFKNLGKSLVILPTSLHDCALVWNDSSLAKFYDQVDICTTDGMPLVLGYKIFAKKHVERVYGPDLMAYLLKRSGLKINHYFLGANSKIEKKLLRYLGSNFPNLKISGVSFLEKNLNEIKNEQKILASIKKLSPTVLWIGIGSPKQVKLAVQWKKKLSQTTIVCVGAAFDLLTTHKPMAPIWVKKIGLEWLFRFLTEPKRLWKRYLVKIPRFILSYSFFKLRIFFGFDEI